MAQRVLIVDDHAVVRRTVRGFFESAGFACGEAENGADAVARVLQEKPDIILLDLSMPVMNGLQAAPLLKDKLPRVPIILYTMHASKEVVDLGHKAGISAIISKDEAITRVIDEACALLKLPAASGES
jgi:two-component system, NarL family, nitrate/nitrite response regulator NarL